MNAILCAISLQHEKKIPITVYWQNSIDCRADFSDLFYPISGLDILPHSEFFWKPNTKRNLHIPGLIRSFIFDRQYDGSVISNRDILLSGKEFGNIYISSANRFCPLEITDQVSRFFIPKLDIQHRIDDVFSKYSRHTIGVHIRRTDNVSAIHSSPIELFISRMEIELANNPETTFFVASDDCLVKYMLKDKFAQHIITYDASLERYSLQGMKDAVVELFLLANTRFILGSSHSTYSTMASSLYNRNLEVLTK